MSLLNLENLLDIPDIIETEKKLRSDMALHIRSLFKEPRSSQFSVDITTKESAYNIASKIGSFSSPEGKLAAEHFTQMIYYLFGIKTLSNQMKEVIGVEDLESFQYIEVVEKQIISIRFLNDVDFVVYTHTISGFSSEDMSLKEIAVFYDIISNIY